VANKKATLLDGTHVNAAISTMMTKRETTFTVPTQKPCASHRNRESAHDPATVPIASE
jgi:hypothetical protein